MTYSNGDRYEGTFERDMRHGSGAFKFANGSAYVGEYYEDRIEGVGKYESHMGGKMIQRLVCNSGNEIILFLSFHFQTHMMANI